MGRLLRRLWGAYGAPMGTPLLILSDSDGTTMTCQSARAPVTELEGTAGVTDVGHGHDVADDVDATKRHPAVTFGQVTTIEVT